MGSRLFVRVMANGQPQGRTEEFPDGQEPAEGDVLKLDGDIWTCMDPERGSQTAPVARLEPATVAHSMPRRGDRRDPGAPRYDHKNRPVLLTSEEKATYAKKFEQHNRENCRFERTSSQGAFGDDE